jgi:protein-disulfide isomerase
VSKAARDQNRAKRIVELQKAAERRRRVTLWTSVSAVLVLVIAGLVAWTVIRNQDKGKVVVPPGAVDGGTAFAVGSGPVTLDLYEDFMCPICHEFENQSGATIKQWVTDKKVTVRYHPVAILDASSNGTKYSSRAAGAAAAAAQSGKLVEFHDVLYANQPKENSSGLTNAKLIELGKSVGLTSTAFTDAIDKGTYVPWAGQVTDTFAKRGYTGTPTIVVNTKTVTGASGGVPTTAELTAAVNAAAG